jgi:arylsulfatase A-like enzyme
VLLTVVAAMLALAGALAVAAEPPSPAPDARPNVVVIMTDDQTVADMAAMPRTRALLGDRGVTFTRSFVSYPLCCPARATFLTGRYAHNTGVKSTTPPDGGVERLDARHTLPVWLARAGYDTIHVGKYLNGYGLRTRPTVPPGWSRWHGLVDKSTYQMYGFRISEDGAVTRYGDFWQEDPRLYQTDVLRDKAVAEIERARDGRPFFLSLAFVAPHGEVREPGAATTPFIRPAQRHEHAYAAAAAPASPAYGEADVSDKPPYVRGLKPLSAAVRARIAADFRSRRASLLAVDEAVAAVVAALERTGALERTWVLFTSDNGFFQGEHRIPKGKYLAYDPATAVPLLVRGPGVGAGTSSAELVSNADLAPTILDAAGARADRTMDGRSLLAYARDPARRSARPVLHEGLIAGSLDRDGTAARGRSAGVYRAIRTRRYLFVMWRGGARELYDLALDPFQLQSRHRDPAYAAVRADLTTELRRVRTCDGPECRAPVRDLQPRVTLSPRVSPSGRTPAREPGPLGRRSPGTVAR